MIAPGRLFGLLNTRVSELRKVHEGHSSLPLGAADSVHRACLVLTVSALDAYMHEKATEIFAAMISSGNVPQVLTSYLSSTASDLQQKGESLIRYKLSFKTLVLPARIDDVIAASGQDPADVWREIGIGRGSRESRLRNSLDLQVDRRNAIAHEGDWDPVTLDLRGISSTHLDECISCVGDVVTGLEYNWKA